MYKIVLLFMLLSGHGLLAQTTPDTASIKAQLKLIFERDQMTRKGKDSVAFAHYIDSTNLVRVEKILSQYGWLGRNTVGDTANSAIFLVIQHADLETQLKYITLLEKSVEAGESRPSNLALMQDRILMRQGKKQIYGSQVVMNKSGGQEFYPIEDEKNVNIRRAKLGMQPLEEYAKLFGIEYTLPVEPK